MWCWRVVGRDFGAVIAIRVHLNADRFLDRYRSLTGYSEDVSPYDISTILSAPHGDFPTHAWNDLGRADLTSNVVTSQIERWLCHVLGDT